MSRMKGYTQQQNTYEFYGSGGLASGLSRERAFTSISGARRVQRIRLRRDKINVENKRECG